MTDRPEHELRTAAQKIIDQYEHDIEQALERRNASLRDLQASGGWTQADLIRATGYSRETIRQALKPEIRQAIKARRAAKSTSRPDTTEET